jgi:hypothetical protein
MERAIRASYRYLVERPHAPLDLGVGGVVVVVREDEGRERTPGGAGDEPVDAVVDVQLLAFELVGEAREVLAGVLAEPVRVHAQVHRDGTPDTALSC